MISISLPFLPPTDNHAYENFIVRGGKGKPMGCARRLSAEGRAFKIEVAHHLSSRYASQLGFFKKNTRYIVQCVFFFRILENKGYPNSTDTRYKIIDGHNRIKLLFDALAEVTGCDDSTFFDVIVNKREGSEHVELNIWNADEEQVTLSFGKEG
jgi:Holliday junction resolvase RusA-like endonuclease